MQWPDAAAYPLRGHAGLLVRVCADYSRLICRLGNTLDASRGIRAPERPALPPSLLDRLWGSDQWRSLAAAAIRACSRASDCAHIGTQRALPRRTSASPKPGPASATAAIWFASVRLEKRVSQQAQRPGPVNRIEGPCRNDDFIQVVCGNHRFQPPGHVINSADDRVRSHLFNLFFFRR